MVFLSLYSFPVNLMKGSRFTLLFVIVFLSKSLSVKSSRNMNITLDRPVVGVWNNEFKTVNKCEMFHEKNDSDLFFSWPEPDFKYCCGEIDNYTYTVHGPALQTTTYHDVGLVDRCLPYWKCGMLSNWRTLTQYVTFNIGCERGDVQKRFSKRLTRVVVLNGFVQSVLPLVVILEFSVFLAIVALSSSGSWTEPNATAIDRQWRIVLTLLCKENYANILANLLHLCALVVLGNCFMEATGHSNPYEWEASMFVECAQYYLLAPSILTVAMFFHQTADWGAARNSIKGGERIGKVPNEVDVPDVPEKDDKINFVCISEDWRWQPVFGQIVVLLLTGCYCVYNSNDHRTEFVSFLLGVVVVCCIWSGLASCALLLRSVRCLLLNLREFHW